MRAAIPGVVRLFFLLPFLGLAACGGSSPPVEGRVDTPGLPGPPGSEEKVPDWGETWQGTTLAANPSTIGGLPPVPPCSQSVDPTCGHHRLVVPAEVRQLLIVIKPDQENAVPVEGLVASNDYTLTVYNDRNELVAYSESPEGSAAESVVIENTGSAYFDVRVSPFLVAPGNTFTGVARAVGRQPIDRVQDCMEAVPQNAGLAGVTDGGERVELAVELLLDGTDPVRAAQVMAKAAESYAPLGVDLVLKRMRPVTIQSLDSTEIIEEGKAHSNGLPPDGIDIVAVFTNKEMQAYDPTGQVGTVIGQADCIGGIRYPERSFAVVTDVTSIEQDEFAPGLYLNMDAAAETMAHEIGHLMGAHHHYGNCVEGNLTSAGPNDVSPCTLMFPAVNGASLNFGTFEGLVVRGHAVEHAAP